MIVVDDFLPNPARVRRLALASEFIDWHAPDGEVYKRICLCEVPGLQDRLEQAMGPVDMLGMGYRLNYGGEQPNAAIHSDVGWGTHALVLYLSTGEGGTAFWRHKATGADRIDAGNAALLKQVQSDWNAAERWERLALCEMRFNRAVIYESARFHSRYPFAAFGTGPQDGRLTVSCFFTPKDSHADPTCH